MEVTSPTDLKMPSRRSWDWKGLDVHADVTSAHVSIAASGRVARPAIMLAQERQRRPGRWPGNHRAAVFKWGRGTCPAKFHLRHRLMGRNPLNGVGGGTRHNAERALDAYLAWRSPLGRELMEILYARWEPPNFGCQPPD